MRKLCALVLLLAACDRPKTAAVNGVIVGPSAGVRYARDAQDLAQSADELLNKSAGVPTPKPVSAVIVPHAALQFCGDVAAAALAPIRDRRYERVVLLAPAHPRAPAGPAALPQSHALRTPLGEVPIDEAAVAALARSPLFTRTDAPFLNEHSIDAPLPLIQRAIGAVPIVPIIVGAVDANGARQLAEALRPLIDARTLVVVSTNFTHYGERFKNTMFAPASGKTLEAQIKQADEILLAPVLSGDLAQFDQLASKTGSTVCGQDALRVLLALLPKDSVGEVRAYGHSMEHDGDEQTTDVSYAGVDFLGGWPDLAPLPDADRQALLDSARAAILAAVSKQPPPAPPLASPRMLEKRGLFVTLYEKGALRASVGQVQSDEVLGRAVIDVAAAAAAQDSRFPPLTAAELPEVKIELAVIGPLHAVNDVASVDLSRQGLVLTAPAHTGVLLPDRADKPSSTEEVLDALAEKADLPRANWPKNSLASFTALIVAEPGAQLTAPPQTANDAGP